MTDPDFLIYKGDHGRHMIEQTVDMQFRSALLAHARRIGFDVAMAVGEALARPPAPATEAYRYFGNRLNDVLNACTVLINELDQFIPGFRRWLDVTEYGSDYLLIAAFEKWVTAVMKMPGGRLN
jgi:hypothetical protein